MWKIPGEEDRRESDFFTSEHGPEGAITGTRSRNKGGSRCIDLSQSQYRQRPPAETSAVPTHLLTYNKLPPLMHHLWCHPPSHAPLSPCTVGPWLKTSAQTMLTPYLLIAWFCGDSVMAATVQVSFSKQTTTHFATTCPTLRWEQALPTIGKEGFCRSLDWRKKRSRLKIKAHRTHIRRYSLKYQVLG